MIDILEIRKFADHSKFRNDQQYIKY